jgi:type III secretory pathway component EscS
MMDAFILTPSEIPHAWTMVKLLCVFVLLGALAGWMERK